MDIREYKEKRDKLSFLYQELQRIALLYGNNNLAERINKSRLLLEMAVFKIVVVGEFSRGKSTFINAMLGKRILPSKTNPTTTIINRISYGNKPEYILHYRDNDKVKQITETEFKSITAVEADSDAPEDLEKYAKDLAEVARIAYAEIHYPISLCGDGIEIIDTPGTNDLDQVREEITFNFIPEADAAIMMLSAEQIAAKSELNFLKERILKNDIQKVFFVINFKDRLDSPEDYTKVINAAEENIRQFTAQPKIYLLSSRDALKYRRFAAGEMVKGSIPESMEETGFLDFEENLSEYLVKEKAVSKLQKYVNRAHDLGNELISSTLELKLAKLGQTAIQIQRSIDELKPRITRCREASHRIFENLKLTMSLAVEEYTGQYQRGLHRVARQAAMSMNTYEGELTGEAIARAIESITAPLQRENEAEISQAINQRINREFQQSREKLMNVFKTENIVENRSLVPASPSSQLPAVALQLDHVSSDESSLVGGGLLLGGLILAVNSPLIMIPIVFFGGQFFMQQFARYKREDFLLKAKEQIRMRYEEIIPAQTDGFKNELKKRLSGTIDCVEDIIDCQLVELQSNLERLLEEKAKAMSSDAEQEKKLKQSINDIQKIQADLLKI